MIDKTLTEEAVSIVTGARNKAYDAPERNFHRIALAWESITDRAYSAAEVSLMMVALKLVRESHMHQRDNIVDGIGYLLTADEVQQINSEPCTVEGCGLVGVHGRVWYPTPRDTTSESPARECLVATCHTQAPSSSVYCAFHLGELTGPPMLPIEPEPEPCTAEGCELVGFHERDKWCPSLVNCVDGCNHGCKDANPELHVPSLNPKYDRC